jgi:hypothetical protein
MESWTFKMECGERFETNEVAATKTFDYIEVFYKWASQYGIRCTNPIWQA